MLTLPPIIMDVLNRFVPVFDRRTWDKVVVLVMGAVLGNAAGYEC